MKFTIDEENLKEILIIAAEQSYDLKIPNSAEISQETSEEGKIEISLNWKDRR